MLSGSSSGDSSVSQTDSSIKVAVRVRPLNEKEINSGQTLGWKVTDNSVSLLENRGYSASKFNYGLYSAFLKLEGVETGNLSGVGTQQTM